MPTLTSDDKGLSISSEHLEPTVRPHLTARLKSEKALSTFRQNITRGSKGIHVKANTCITVSDKGPVPQSDLTAVFVYVNLC